MRIFLIKILFRLLKIPIATKVIDQKKLGDWLGSQYPMQSFRDYISARNLHILQVLGEGVSSDKDYWTYVGQRIELNKMLGEAKINFERMESDRRKKQAEEERKKNENA